MTRRSRILIAFIALIAALSFLALVSCDGDDDDDDDDDNDTADDDDDDSSDDDDDDDDDDPGDPIEPTQGYLDRQAEYLQYCSEQSGPGGGGIHGQITGKAERTVTVRVTDGTKIKFEKSSISQVFPKSKGGAEAEADEESTEDESEESSDK